MTRLLEVLVALFIVFLLTVIYGVLLPSHGHIERTLEISHPLRQVYDVLNGYRTYPVWNALSAYDPKLQLNFEGPEAGKGARVKWYSLNETVGTGSLSIIDSEPDKSVVMAIENGWRGTNKTYTIDLKPGATGKTLKITWAYDVDYGWNLRSRYSGLYLEGDPATQVQVHLNKLANMLATFPNVDYKNVNFSIVDVPAKPVLFISTKAKRTLDDVAEATDKAMTEIQTLIRKYRLNQVGPRQTITTNWGDENYEFDIAVPVDHADIPISGNVKAGNSYSGKALMVSLEGSPAQLPPARLMLKAYAYTHGYLFDESSEGSGRFFDELTSEPKAADDAQKFNVYLPIQI